MRGTEFFQAMRGKALPAWESLALDLARRGLVCGWPLVPLRIDGGGHTCVLRVATDVFAVGTPDDHLRLPLTPGAAQKIADALGMMLPTRKIATEVWRQADARLTPTPMAPNLGASLQQFADHDAAISAQLAALGRRPGLVTGHKKDVVTGRLVRPGKVVIWGWFWPDDPNVHGPYMTANLRASQPIQPLSDAHGDGYVDYSHSVRLVEPVCVVDGERRQTADVLADPELSTLLSDEGPLDAAHVRYPVGAPVQGVPYALVPGARTSNMADRGLDYVRAEVLERRNPS